MMRKRYAGLGLIALCWACPGSGSPLPQIDGGPASGGGHGTRDAMADAQSSYDAAVARDAQAERDAQVAGDAGTHDAGAAGDSGLATTCDDTATGFGGFDLHCSTADDCALVQRTLSCCGTQLVTGVNHSEIKAFEQAAARCDALFPACGCATFPTQADDLTTASDTHPHATVACVPSTCATPGCAPPSQCRTTFGKSMAKTTCGPNGVVCDALTEVCVQREPVGPAIVYECKPIPVGCQERRDCACAGASLCTGGFNVCTDVAANTIDCMCPLCQ